MPVHRCVWRRLAAVLVLATMAAAPFAPMCAGWHAVATERMACCRAAAHHCDTTIADDCCAAGEQRQNASASLPFTRVPAIALSVSPPAVALREAAPIVERTAPTHPSPPDTYLFGPAFLI